MGKSELPPGQALREPAPLFRKLDESVIEEEYARLDAWKPDWANRQPAVG